jgi:hypothetical protein
LRSVFSEAIHAKGSGVPTKSLHAYRGDNIKMNLKETRVKNVDWIRLLQYRDQLDTGIAQEVS